jgi:Sec-independent protein secretion pathway component TatC
MKKISKISAALTVGLLYAMPVLAQDQLSGVLPDLTNGGGASGLILWVIRALLGICGLVAVLFIIIGGFQYITSGASEDLAKRGKSTLVNAIIGLIIVILSYTIVIVVVDTLFPVG